MSQIVNKCVVLLCNNAASDSVSVFKCIDKHVLHPVGFHIFSKWDQFYGIHDYPNSLFSDQQKLAQGSTANGTLYYF